MFLRDKLCVTWLLLGAQFSAVLSLQIELENGPNTTEEITIAGNYSLKDMNGTKQNAHDYGKYMYSRTTYEDQVATMIAIYASIAAFVVISCCIGVCCMCKRGRIDRRGFVMGNSTQPQVNVAVQAFPQQNFQQQPPPYYTEPVQNFPTQHPSGPSNFQPQPNPQISQYSPVNQQLQQRPSPQASQISAPPQPPMNIEFQHVNEWQNFEKY